MAEQKIKVFASLSKEYLYGKGIESGLSEKAADYFKHFSEVKIDLIVDSETGEVKEYHIFQVIPKKEPVPVENPCPKCGKEWDAVQDDECQYCGNVLPF